MLAEPSQVDSTTATSSTWGHPTLTSMANTIANMNTTTSPSEDASADVNDAHQHTNDERPANKDEANVPNPCLRIPTSQCCTAVSVETCNAIARFLGRHWGNTRVRVGDPRFLQNLHPDSLKPLSFNKHWYGVSGIRGPATCHTQNPVILSIFGVWSRSQRE